MVERKDVVYEIKDFSINNAIIWGMLDYLEIKNQIKGDFECPDIGEMTDRYLYLPKNNK